MLSKPRPFTSTFFNWKELMTSIIQGLAITAGSLLIYQYGVYNGLSESMVRTMVFCVLISGNITLTLVNRSFYYSIFTTLRYNNKLVPFIIFVTITISGMLIYLKPLADFFQFKPMHVTLLLLSTGTGFASVIWFEAVKWRKRDLSESFKDQQFR